MAVKKLAPIPKSYSPDFVSLESSLAKNGYSRNPGASVTKLPYKEFNGKYRTGLDENAIYLERLPKEEREAEIERIIADRERLEKATGFDLSPTSSYYNFASQQEEGKKVQPIKLGSQPKGFNTADPLQEIAWNWIKVHPTIAPSLAAVQNKQVDISVVQYYVADDEAETRIIFKKKQLLNKAIAKLDEVNEVPDKIRQIGRLMGLPVTESTPQAQVYNLIDTVLKEGEFTTGEYKGSNPITVFTELCSLNEQRAHVKDLVNEAIKTSIYRVRHNGKLFEGENEVASSKETMVSWLLDDKHQDDLFALQKKLKINKITAA